MYKYFKKSEFNCNCGCGLNNTKDELINKLDEARELAGISFNITSGTRCDKHNKKVGGVENSEHLTGEGVDICTRNSEHRFRILMSLVKVGFNRIGIGRDFIHVGIGEYKTQGVTWLYGNKKV